MAEHPLYDTPYGKVTQFERKLAEAGLNAYMIDAINKKRGLAKSWVDDLRQRLDPTPVAVTATGLDRYTPYLLSVTDQLERISEFNDRFWGGFFTQEEAALALGIVGTGDYSHGHVQSVDDLEILYVDFGSPEKTVEMWWKVLVGTQPNAWRWDKLKTDAKHLRLHSYARQYGPGIHRVRINLVANWEPKDGRTVIQARERALATAQTLAAGEVLAAYGLHDELLRQQDGENLPYTDLAGYEATLPGDRPWAHYPYLDWSRSGRRVRLLAYWTAYVSYYDWAAPVVRES